MKYLSTKQMSEKFGVSRQAVFNWIKRGYLKVEYIGGIIRIPEEEAESFKRPPLGRPPEVHEDDV